jgi:YHS domain-containing protein
MKRTIVAAALIVLIAVTSMMVVAQARRDEAKDPVCGLTVAKNPELSAGHRGETYYFCSRADMDKFKKEPDRYTKKR